MTQHERRTAEAQQLVLEAVQITTVLEGRPVAGSEVYAYLQGEHAGYGEDEIRAALSELQDAGLIMFENSPEYATWGWVPSGYPSQPGFGRETTPVNVVGVRARGVGRG